MSLVGRGEGEDSAWAGLGRRSDPGASRELTLCETQEVGAGVEAGGEADVVGLAVEEVLPARRGTGLLEDPLRETSEASQGPSTRGRCSEADLRRRGQGADRSSRPRTLRLSHSSRSSPGEEKTSPEGSSRAGSGV